MKKQKRLVVLDTHAILHRGYHAMPNFASSKGEPTGALFGLVSMLTRIIGDLKPDYIIAALDLPEPTLHTKTTSRIALRQTKRLFRNWKSAGLFSTRLVSRTTNARVLRPTMSSALLSKK
jgi:5'-3' exonuclease